ncbi:hypothetical protein ACLB2K_059610 [Fragaria x ananassa]
MGLAALLLVDGRLTSAPTKVRLCVRLREREEREGVGFSEISPLVTRIITIPEKNFNTPSSPQIDLTMMEREHAKYQMIVSPQVAVPVINLDEEESDIEIELTEEDSGRTTSALGMYSYVARIKNKQRRPAKRDDIYWWGEVKNNREKKATEIAEERKKTLKQKRKNKIGEGDEQTEYGDVIHTIGDDEMEPMPIQIVPTTARPIWTMTKKVVWTTFKAFKCMDPLTKKKWKTCWDNLNDRDFLWEGLLYGSELIKLDMLEVIIDKVVACNVIDCFGAIIADEISQQDS